MIYANDLWAQIPTQDLYDTNIMSMAINAARDMYNKRELRLNNFFEKYGDFYSPIERDNEWHLENVINPVKNTIQALYDQFQDPLRSAEAGAIIANAINGIDYGRIARNVASAKNYQTYLENAAKLDQLGLFNLEYENWILDQLGLTDFDSSKGIWGRLSPGKYQDPAQIADHLFNGMKEEYMGRSRDGSKDLYGISRDRRRVALLNNLAEILGTQNGQYLYNSAEEQLKASGIPNPTSEQIRNRFIENILDNTSKYDYSTVKENPEYARKRAAYWSNYYGGDKDNTSYPNIFREADRKWASGNSNTSFTTFNTKYIYENKIEPTNRNVVFNPRTSSFTIPKNTLNSVIYERRVDKNGVVKLYKKKFTKLNEGDNPIGESVEFLPTGAIERISGTDSRGNRSNGYYIHGNLQTVDQSGNASYIKDENGSLATFAIPVKERDYRYNTVTKGEIGYGK